MDRSQTEKIIVGALKAAIDAHGPITLENRSSAAKRVYTALKQDREELARLQAIEEAAWRLIEHPTSEAKLQALAKTLGVEL